MTDFKTILFVMLTIVKVIAIIIGVGLIIKNFNLGMRSKESDGKVKALKYLGILFLFLLIVTLVEFGISNIFKH